MRIYRIETREAAFLEQLLFVWERSVRATHHFLKEADIVRLRPLVLEGLKQIAELWCIMNDKGAPVAFLGADGEKVEMLFVDEQHRGRGYGRALLQMAVNGLGCKALDVNEDNPQAVAFYAHMGFTVTGRSPVDEQGAPFPLLHMKLAQV